MGTKVSEAIATLRQALPSAHLVSPEATEEYDILNGSYLSGFESDLYPACIFLHRSKEEVATFVQTFQPFVDDVQFAVRSGGQQPLPGCANVDGGITVELRDLRGIKVQDGGDVYEHLEPYRLGVTGGLSSTCGIDGLSTQGLICDNGVNYEIVVGSGEIINENSQENSDLWITLRGGGNNFGIITRFDFRTFEQGPMYAGMVWYFKPSFTGQIKALVKELTSSTPCAEAHYMLSIAFSQAFGNGDDVVCLDQLCYTQPIADPAILAPFVHVEPQRQELNTMKIQTLVQAANEQAGAAQSNIRCLYMNINVKANADTLITGGDIWCEELQLVKDVAALMWSYTLQVYPESLINIIRARGGNVLGLGTGGGTVINVLLLSDRIEENAATRGQLVPWIFWCYTFSHQKALESYGEQNVRKLREASKKYDPEGLFQKGCPGGYKLFK
ncbi:FAD-binding domain-containing protein [Xylariaceae sp. FL0255]|nr:FAD-binding domain-containing protein [Xylariaceae sp. FL0255]